MSLKTSIFDTKIISRTINILVCLSLILVLSSTAIDFRNTIKYGGVDLRNRVVGARVLMQKLDPYFYKWNTGDDEKLLDPLDEPNLPVSRVTVNPSVLLFHSLFANLPYFHQRILWFVLQTGMLLTSLLLWNIHKLNTLRNKLIFIFVSVGMVISQAWKLHVDVGQFYIVYIFLLSIAYRVLKSEYKYREITAGCIIGLTVLFRFPIIVFTLPMILSRQVKLFVATLLGFGAFLGLSIFGAGYQAWQSYFSAMIVFSKLTIDAVSVTSKRIVTYPTIIEGMGNIKVFGEHHNDNTSIISVFKRLLGISLESKFLIIGLAISLLIYSVVLFRSQTYQKFHKSPFQLELTFLIGSICILIADFFLPAPRYIYNNIQFLIPFIILCQNTNYSHLRMLGLFIVMIFSCLISNGLFLWLPKEVILGPFLTIFSMILMSILMVINPQETIDISQKDESIM